ncbi:MAG: nucleotidyltransferase domain-containing protein [Clostridium sp.]|uniref:nucleotidyltransferase domain-containing protein n=1 Tax=Clostridium sp. TaxID=1506 RepID=UPI003D6D353F
MNREVKYSLDVSLRLEIVKVKNAILTNLHGSKIFLFGSIAKGCYSKYSDIDLLVLIDSYKSKRELRQVRHEIEDSIEDLNISKEVDIKLYTTARYNEICIEPSFEKSILEDFIDIGGW